MKISIEKKNCIEEKELKKISERVLQGELVIYPTDTVYGLGAVIQNEVSIKKIYEAKSRSFSLPLIALIDSIERIESIAYLDDTNKILVKKLAEKFWPGALTIILKKKDTVPAIMVSGGETVGVRIPNLELSLKIIKAAGGILATTSANISGEPSPKSYQELSEDIRNRVDILIDGGKCDVGEVSTIIDLSHSKPRLLRQGAISMEEIKKIIGEIEV